MTPLFVHLGGLHEIGVYVVPVILGLYALRWAEKRARKREADEEAANQPRDATASTVPGQTTALDAGEPGAEA